MPDSAYRMPGRIIFLTNIPAPYRERVHELVHAEVPTYEVVYCDEREPNRSWVPQYGDYPHTFLKRNQIAVQGRFIHVNFDVFSVLNRLDPSVVITTGFNPTFLIAFFWCLLRRRSHVCFTDGWIGSEATLSWLHRVIRRLVYSCSKAFIGASAHSLALYRAYGAPESALFQSHLCADNDRFAEFKDTPKSYDLAFSGQFIQRKCPQFFVDVAAEIKRRRGTCSVLLMGDGPLKPQVIDGLCNAGVEFHDAGFVNQAALPGLYSQARVLLFPTQNDPWGVVANEACAVGVPVITCEAAGVAHDLIVNGKTGYVLALDVQAWADQIERLLNLPDVYASVSTAAFEWVQAYSYSAAAQGLKGAIAYCGGR